MKTNKKTVRIPGKIISRYNKLLAKSKVDFEKEGIDQYTTVYSVAVNFGKGIEADIKVCSGENDLFLNPVLFDSSCDVGVIDDNAILNDEFEFKYNGQQYVVCIKEI